MFLPPGMPTFGDTQTYDTDSFSVDSDFTFGGAIGKSNFIGPIAMEIDVLKTSRGYTGFRSSLESTSVMVNFVYDTPITGPIGTYVGGGAGMVNIKYNGADELLAFTGKQWRFGWQALAGVDLKVGSSPFSAFGEWRYQDATDATIQSVANISYSGHSVLGGIRFDF